MLTVIIHEIFQKTYERGLLVNFKIGGFSFVWTNFEYGHAYKMCHLHFMAVASKKHWKPLWLLSHGYCSFSKRALDGSSEWWVDEKAWARELSGRTGTWREFGFDDFSDFGLEMRWMLAEPHSSTLYVHVGLVWFCIYLFSFSRESFDEQFIRRRRSSQSDRTA